MALLQCAYQQVDWGVEGQGGGNTGDGWVDGADDGVMGRVRNKKLALDVDLEAVGGPKGRVGFLECRGGAGGVAD